MNNIDKRKINLESPEHVTRAQIDAFAKELKEKCIPQYRLATMMDVSRRTVSRWITGECEIKLVQYNKILYILQNWK